MAPINSGHDFCDPVFDIRGKVVLIAGAGGGLGQVIAESLSARGAKLVLFDSDPEKTMEIAEKIPEAVTETASITDSMAIEKAVQLAVNTFGELNGAINSTGIFSMGESALLDEAEFRKCIDINLTGAFLFSQATMKAMKKNGGRIIHLSSVSSLVSNTRYAAYASSKAALTHLVRVLGREWAPFNILVNAIGPAMVETPMSAGNLKNSGYRKNVLSVIPAGRLGLAEDLIGTVILLLSNGGSFIAGQTIYIDGGRTLV